MACISTASYPETCSRRFVRGFTACCYWITLVYLQQRRAAVVPDVSRRPRPPPEGCPAFLPLNLCIQNQKTLALQVSCHMPVFPQALMENGRMEWGEIYGTNPSRVLKTLASAAATSSSFSPLPCSPLLLQPEPGERETGQPIRCVSQSRASHPVWPKCSAGCSLETRRTWTPVTPCGGSG